MSMKNEAKGIGFAVLRIGLGIAVAALIAFAVLAYRSHSGRYTQNVEYTDLDALMEKGEALPDQEFGRLTVRWILGNYATENDDISFLGIPFKTGEYRYYLAIAPDLSLITVRTSDKEEIAQLEALADRYWEAATQKELEAIPGYEARGKTDQLKEGKLKTFYDETLDEMGYEPGGRLKKSGLMIDTGAVSDRNAMLFIILPIFGLIVLIIVVIAFRMRRKPTGAPRQEGAPAEPGLSGEAEIPEEYRKGTDL